MIFTPSATYENMTTQEYDEYDMVVSVLLFGQPIGLELLPFSCGHTELKAMQKLWTDQAKSLPSPLLQLKKKNVSSCTDINSKPQSSVEC